MKRIVSLLLAVAMVFTLAACAPAPAPAAQEVATTPAPTAAQAATAAPTVEPAPAPEAETPGDYTLKPGKYVIGLSNSYYGNTWRKQSVENFNAAAEEALAKGYISKYEVQNGDGTVNAQIQQINGFILAGVDAICINAASPTALNSVIKKAYDAGIKVIVYDSIVTSPYAYTIDFSFIDYGRKVVNSIASIAGENAKCILVRGVSGSAPDIDMFEGNTLALAEHPNMEVVATVNGEASATKTQEEITKILPSLGQVDAVITQGGGDAFGAAQAFEQSGLKIPVIIGDNSGDFIQWWIKQKDANGYKTASQGTAPSIASAGFWVALYVLNGCDVPLKMNCDFASVDNSNLDDFKDIQLGTIASPNFTPEVVVEKIIKPFVMK